MSNVKLDIAITCFGRNVEQVHCWHPWFCNTGTEIYFLLWFPIHADNCIAAPSLRSRYKQPITSS